MASLTLCSAPHFLMMPLVFLHINTVTHKRVKHFYQSVALALKWPFNIYVCHMMCLGKQNPQRGTRALRDSSFTYHVIFFNLFFLPWRATIAPFCPKAHLLGLLLYTHLVTHAQSFHHSASFFFFKYSVPSTFHHLRLCHHLFEWTLMACTRLILCVMTVSVKTWF